LGWAEQDFFNADFDNRVVVVLAHEEEPASDLWGGSGR
jgi:hypothetical protein